MNDKKFIVIGAGISGLSLAYYLRQSFPSSEIYISEKETLGGQLKTLINFSDDKNYEVGAEAFITRRPEVLGLLKELNLEDQVVYSDTTKKTNIIYKNSSYLMPARSYVGIPYDPEEINELVSNKTLLKMKKEKNKKLNWTSNSDKSIGLLVEECYGKEIVEKFVEPIISGVYAASSYKISLRYALPELARVLDSGETSLTSALVKITSNTKKDIPIFGAISNGYSTLINSLFNEIDAKLIPETKNITNDYIQTDDHKFPYDHLFLACGIKKTIEFLHQLGHRNTDLEKKVTVTPTVALVEITGKVPANSGLLIANSDKIKAKAVTFITEKWPHLKLNKNLNIVRMSYGRYGDETSSYSDSDFKQIVESDLKAVLNHNDFNINKYHIQRWTNSFVIPEPYESLDPFKMMLYTNKITIAGNYIQGIGVGSCISYANKVVELLLSKENNGKN